MGAAKVSGFNIDYVIINERQRHVDLPCNYVDYFPIHGTLYRITDNYITHTQCERVAVCHLSIDWLGVCVGREVFPLKGSS